MRVMGWPAFKLRDYNPYTYLLYSHIQQRGIHVEEPSLGAVLRGDYQLIHFHWPEHVFDNRSVYKAVPRALFFCGLLLLALLRRKKIIWTVHNLQAHAPWHAKLQRVLWTVFTRRIDGYIVLSESARGDVVRKYPHLAHLPAFVIPHGHYRSEYPDTVDRAEARKTLGLAPDDNVVLFFGAITPYKNIVALLEAFARTPDPSYRLVVAGKPSTTELAGQILEHANADARIRPHLHHIPVKEVQHFFRAADLTVLPYRNIQNSGTALLSLTFDCPVLVPDRGGMVDLQQRLGLQWVRTYAEDLDTGILQDAMRAGEHVAPRRRALTAEFEWDLIAQDTAAAYERVLGWREKGSQPSR